MSSTRSRFVLSGLIVGLAWGSALRAWMTLISVAIGEQPLYDWALTFLLVLFPSTLIGGIYGWAEWARRHGRSSGWRYSALAPLLFILIPFIYDPSFFDSMFDDGFGSGGPAVALLGLIGGYGFSRRGPKAGWITAMVVTVAALVAFVYAVVTNLDVPASLEPLPAMISVTFISLMIVWIAASTIPHKPPQAKAQRLGRQHLPPTIL